MSKLDGLALADRYSLDESPDVLLDIVCVQVSTEP